MKAFIFFFFCLGGIARSVSAQTETVPQNAVLLQADTTAKLTSFTGKYNSGKVYLKWIVANQHEDGLYLVYRSLDGVNYENIGSKQGIGVLISKDIAYYFIDDKCLTSGTKQYRLVHVNADHAYMASETIVVSYDNALVTKTE